MALAGGLWTAIHSALGHSIPPHSVHEEAFGTCYKTVATWCKLPNKLTLSRATPMADTQPSSSWAKRLLLYFSFQESFLQLWRLTTHYLSHSAYITVCLISAGNKVPIWFPNWESGQKRWDIFVATHKGKDTNFFFLLLLLKGLIWSSWDTKFTSGIRSWEKKEKTGIKNNFASKAVKQQLLIVWTWLFH